MNDEWDRQHKIVGARHAVPPLQDNPRHHHRRSIRLRGYDYSQAGAYFITICAQDRTCLFGDVVDGEMRLNDAGGDDFVGVGRIVGAVSTDGIGCICCYAQSCPRDIDFAW